MAFDDNVLDSYFFTAVWDDELASDGMVQAVSDRFYCPGDVPTFVLSPGEALIDIVAVPVPEALRGTATLDVGLSPLRLEDPQRCGSSTEMQLSASVAVSIAPADGPEP